MTPAAPNIATIAEPGQPGRPTTEAAPCSATRVVLGIAIVLTTLFLIGFVYVQISLQLTDAVGGCGGG